MMMRENEKSLRALAMLRYQADRYQSAGNGAMSQRLNAEIRRLMSEMKLRYFTSERRTSTQAPTSVPTMRQA